MPWSILETLASDLRFALRAFIRAPRFALAVSGTVALAIAVNIVAFGTLRAVLFGDRPFRHADRIVLINQTAERVRPMGFNSEELDVLTTLPAIEVVAGIQQVAALVRGNSAPEYLTVGQVTPGFFDVFDATVIRGRALGATDFTAQSQVAVIAHDLWIRQFQRAEDIVGQTMRIGDDVRTIVGVMGPGFDTAFPDGYTAAIWVPKATPEHQLSWSTFARTTPEADVTTVATQVRTAMAPLQAARPPIEFPEFVTRIDGVAVERLGEKDAATARPGLLTFQALAGLLFLIAAANLANMFLARTLARRRELGTRTALGAGRSRVLVQLMTEGSVLAMIGAAAGLLLAYWTLPLLYADTGVLPRAAQPRVNLPEVVAGLGAAWLLAFLFAGLPAVMMTRRDPLTLMRGEFAAQGARVTRWGLVAAQVALGVVVLVSAGLLVRSFVRVINEPLGFRPSGLVVAALRVPQAGTAGPEAFVQQTRAFLETELGPHGFSLGDMPFASSAATTTFSLGPQPFAWETSFNLNIRSVDARYFDTLGIAVRHGRGFAAVDTPTSQPVVVVNEAFVRRHAAGRDVIGTPLRTQQREYVIVGVVNDVRMSRLTGRPASAAYRLLDQQPNTRFAIAVKSANVRAVGGVVERLAGRLGPDVVVSSVGAVTDRIARTEVRRRFYLVLLGSLGVLAAALSAVGIVGVMATTMASRRRELAIRLALGGTPGRVRMTVASAGFAPVIVGLVAGVVAAWSLARWAAASEAIQSQLYQITARDPLTLTVSAAVLLVVGAAACWLPARKASAINPMVVLKSE
jgi:predicted permease